MEVMFGDFALRDIVIFLAVLLVSTSFHELMHALVAYKLGDDLAHSHGRISLNPLAHIDPLLTIGLPLFMIMMGAQPILAAKPVPVNSLRLKGGDNGMAVVAVAGPLTNLAIAIVAAGVLRTLALDGLGFDIVSAFFQLNIALFVFNMIPFPPLDGSRVLYAFAPEPVQRVMAQIESFGIFGLIIFITLFSSVITPLILNVEDILTRLLIG
jgi:Zn-dependent protease